MEATGQKRDLAAPSGHLDRALCHPWAASVYPVAKLWGHVVQALEREGGAVNLPLPCVFYPSQLWEGAFEL